MIDITMPRLSDSMEEGTILRWLIEDGQPVAKGEDLIEIETDKANMTYAAEAEGVLEIVVAEGETVPVGTVIARASAPGVRPAGAGAGAGQAGAAGDGQALETPPGAPPEIAVTTEPPARAELAPANGHTDGVQRPSRASVTPLARRIAATHGLTLEAISGTGPGGRITRRDVLGAAGLDPVPEAPQTRSSPPTVPEAGPSTDAAPAERESDAASTTSAKGATETQELTRVQQVIARRMAETKATVPDFQVQTEVLMDEAIALRARLKAVADGSAVPSFNDMIIKACAVALRKHPRANGSYRDGRFELHGRVNIGFAVAAEDALVVPTLTDADIKSLAQIAEGSRRLAERVRAGEITPPELSGATFTVSNLGMFGMTAITPVINSPQAAILGVGTLRETLARVDGEIVDRTLMTLSLTCDHRILYGADAARLLAEIKRLIETPLRLVL